MVEKVISQVQFEMGQIDLLFDSYADLLERAEKKVTFLSTLIFFLYGVGRVGKVGNALARGLDPNQT